MVCGSNSTPAQREETRSGGFIISALPVIVLLLLHAVQVTAGAVSGLLFFVCGLIPLTGGASERKVTPWSTVSLTRTLMLGACCSFLLFFFFFPVYLRTRQQTLPWVFRRLRW